MSAPQPVPGILVTHGDLGAELVRTSESILGPQESLTVVSNSGKPPDVVRSELEGLIPADQPVVLFVDLLGGSCGHVCALVRRHDKQILLAGGVNLPMLLEFLYHRRRVPLQELKERVLRKGREGIKCYGWDPEVHG